MAPWWCTIIHSFALHLYTNHAYHISVDTLYWHKAEIYCINLCNSHLSSIHSAKDHQHLIHQISNITHDTVLSVPSNRDTWIGLHRYSTTDPWTYADSTSFDYGNPPAAGYYPWSAQFADDEAGGIKLQGADDEYAWDDKYYDSSSRQFSCNHCDSVLTKYVMLGENYEMYNRTDAAEYGCSSKYGTTLASIHSLRDWNEATLLCYIFNQQYADTSDVRGCYIGLLQVSNGDFVWDDGTTFDFATDLSDTNFWHWSSASNSRECINLDEDNNFVLNSVNCRSYRYSLCHMPSEVCYEDRWFAIYGTGPFFSSEPPCEIKNGYAANKIYMIHNSRWENHGAPIVFDYTFSVPRYDTGATAGVIFHIDTSCAYYYYIGISLSDRTVFLATVTNEIITIIHERSLRFVPSSGVFYLLGGVISNSNTFTISVNDNVLLSNVKGSDDLSVSDTNIAYIGIKNTVSSLTAKALYVSGERIIANGNDPTQWFQDCITTTAPISTTTSSSSTTEAPTAKPTYISTTNHVNIALISTSDEPTAKIITNEPTASKQPSSAPQETILLSTDNFVIFETVNTRSKQSKSDVFKTQIHGIDAWIYMVIICVVLCICCSCILVFCVFCKKRRTHKPLEEVEENTTEIVTVSDAKAEKREVKHWLTEIGLPEYYKLFIKNGYESLKFIKGMDDKSLLKQIGIKKLGHQTILWSSIKKLQLMDATNTHTTPRQSDYLQTTEYDAQPGAMERDRESTWGAHNALPSTPPLRGEGEGDTVNLIKQATASHSEQFVSSNSEQLYVVNEVDEHETLGGDEEEHVTKGFVEAR